MASVLTLETAILAAGILLFAGVLASRFSDLVGVPSLLLFLGLGMLAGSEGLGGIEFDSSAIAQSVGTVALLVILFAGGLETRWSEVKPVLAPGLLLSTVGVTITTVVLGAFAWYMLGTYSDFDIGTHGLGWLDALLLAAIVSSTDAAAVFSVFRGSDVQPRRKLRFLLEFESGSNDPMAVLLTTLLLGFMASGGASGTEVLIALLLQFAVGAAAGVLLGGFAAAIVKRLRLSSSGLYPILVLSCALIAFGLAEAFGGNGFLSVYAAGVMIGNRVDESRDTIIAFHEGLSWLMQIAMFVILGLLVFPSRLLPVAGVAVAMAFFLMFVARPLSVFICLLPFRMSGRELSYVSWVGLRGSVPIILATFPASYGIAGADAIFNVIFFIVLTSVLVQGLTLIPAARILGVLVHPNGGPGDHGEDGDTTAS